MLPGTTSLEVLGETNEDRLDILRIQRVRNAAGDLLYNIDVGHPDRDVEDRSTTSGPSTSTTPRHHVRPVLRDARARGEDECVGVFV